MEELLTPIIFVLLIGGVSGYFAGQLVKRASGMALTVGIIIATILILAYTGIFNLNFDSINASIASFFSVLTTMGIIALVSSVPFVASFIAGIFIGYRRY